MRIRTWKALLRADFKLYLREPAATFFVILFPALLLLISGYSYGQQEVFTTASGIHVRILDLMLPGTLAWVMATQGLLGVYPVLTSQRETKILKYFRTHPIRAFDMLLSQYVNGLLMLTLSLLLLVFTDVVLFGLRYDGYLGLILVGILLSYSTFFAMGFALAGITPTARMAQALGSLLFFPMMFLSGAFGPRDTLPSLLKFISDLSPLTHATDILMQFWFSGGEALSHVLTEPLPSFQKGTPLLGYVWFRGMTPLQSMGYLLLLTGISSWVAIHTFRWDEEPRPRKGARPEVSVVAPQNVVVWAKDLYKAYGPVQAVSGISFDVASGEIYGVLGPNGAGKTTTLEIIEGLRVADRGVVRLLGLDPIGDYDTLVHRIGVQLQEANLPPRLKVRELFNLFAACYEHTASIDSILEKLDLTAQAHTFFGKLSGGQKQRVFAGLALINDPEVIFLDEITTGLDAHIRRQIWGYLRELRRQGKTIVLTTHYLEEAQALCDRVIMLDKGRIVAIGSPSELIQQLGLGFRLEVEFPDGIVLTDELLEKLPGVTRWTNQDGTLTLYLRSPEDTDRVLAAFRTHNLHYRSLRAQPATLEDAFLALTSNHRTLVEKNNKQQAR